MKKCIKCEVRKPVDDFLLHYNKQRGKHYRRGVCKECRSAATRANYQSKDRQNDAKKARYNSDPEFRRRVLSGQHKSRYGITLDEKDSLLAQQGGRCAACPATEPGGHGWATDHDHNCCPGVRSCGNCIRGILCQGCNLALGHCGDSIERLWALIDYLTTHELTPTPA